MSFYHGIAFKKIAHLLGWLLVLILITLLPAYTQDSYLVLPDGQRLDYQYFTPAFHHCVFENGKLKSLEMENPAEIISVIVQFQEAPAAVVSTVAKSNQKQRIESQHVAFKSALANLVRSQSGIANLPLPCQITREYFVALNGLALQAPRGLVRKLSALPMVKQVTEDRTFKACLEHSVAQIRADRVQDELGFKGKGVLVGVLDTGIDYTHPALGGGFGSGFRVGGGYDFAYNDPDPLDANGHGTHVAGIIGANSRSLTGVAPEVQFLAVKVLNDGGSGKSSDIIAGIEYCLDPDGDPATDDAVDIMNMSFGGRPTADDPVVTAVNNAAAAGVLSVISAGNSGWENPFDSAFETIGAPAIAECALTVGACDSANKIAEFSSKGPDPVYLAIKPELVAPGVDIHSAELNGETGEKSGTSMSAPHVVGAAALLKEQHPDWTVEHIKWALVNAASPVAGNASHPYIHGNGRVDCWNAAHLDFVVTPGVLSFGVADLAQEVWQDTLSFQIKNLSAIPRQFNLAVQHDLPAGADLILSQTSLAINSQAEATVTAILSVAKSVPIVKEDPFAYWGHVLCTADTVTVRLPFGFIKSNILVIDCDLEPWELFIWDPLSVKSTHVDGDLGVKRYTIRHPEGTYNLLAFMSQTVFEPDTADNFYVVEKENIEISGLTYVTVSHQEAIYRTNPDLVYDVRDNPRTVENLIRNHFDLDIVRRIENALSSVSFGISATQVYTSAIDTSVKMELNFIYGPPADLMILNHLSKGVTSQEDLTLLTGSAYLSAFPTKFRYLNEQSRKKSLAIGFRNDCFREGGRNGSGHGFYLRDIIPRQITFSKSQTEIDSSGFQSFELGINETDSISYKGHTFKLGNLRVQPDGRLMVFECPMRRPFKNNMIMYQFYQSDDTLFICPNSEILLPVFEVVPGKGMILQMNDIVIKLENHVRLAGYHRNSSNGIVSPTGVFADNIFSKNEQMYFQLNNKGVIVDPIDIGNSFFILSIFDTPIPDRFQLNGTSVPYQILGQAGVSTIDFEFDARQEMANIPMLDLLQILADGKPIQLLRPDQTGQIRLKVYERYGSIETVHINLITSAGQEIELENTLSDREYLAPIPVTLPHEFIDLKVEVADAHQNKFEFIANPAFFFGESGAEIQFDSRVRLARYRLENTDEFPFNAGDTLHYELTFVNDGNLAAEDIRIDFPENEFFKATDSQEITLSKLAVNDTARFQLALLMIQDNQFDKSLEYKPVVAWKTNQKGYARTYRMVVETFGTATTSNALAARLPLKFRLYPNYPNPFNPRTTIEFDLPQAEKVLIQIYDVLGRYVQTLIDKPLKAGRQQVVWNGTDASGNSVTSGIYFYTIRAGNKVKSGKMLFLR